MSSLTLEHIRKEYSHPSQGNLVAVNDLNIEVKDGEFLVIVGPSGCGKSTTLNCIAGLERVSSGDIYLGDKNITNAKPRDRNMAMVFQDYALYPHMTARENMAFGLKMSTDLSKSERNDQVEEAARIMDILDLLDKKPGELSGGQQQRVALGRAIVREPEVFLMDEPLSNLDAKLRTQMRTEVQNIHQNLGVTTLYVTHDQTEAMTMSDRIAVLNNGELQQIGTPLDCYNNPNNLFVAGFIGSPGMNFFNVEYNDGYLKHDDFSYELSPETRSTLEGESSRLVLGIRPESIEFGEISDENSITVPVDVVEPMGDRSHLIFEIGGETRTASIDGNLLVEEGTEIDILFPEEHIHIFDRSSGDTIKNSDATTKIIESKSSAIKS